MGKQHAERELTAEVEKARTTATWHSSAMDYTMQTIERAEASLMVLADEQ